MKFEATLKKHGFKKHRERDNGTTIEYAIGNEAGNMRWAEILKYSDGIINCWVVGKDIEHITISNPGGRIFYEIKKLDEYLSSLPKFKPTPINTLKNK